LFVLGPKNMLPPWAASRPGRCHSSCCYRLQ